MTKVRDRMSGEVAAIPLDMTLVEAAKRMRESGVGGLPVLGAEGQACAGILTERDVVVRVLAEERDPRTVIARDIATLRPVTCEPGDEIGRAVELMREHEVQRLPVVEGGTVIGVSSLADIAFERPDEERGALG